ncbi:four-carbon acid sugar kinase family protein [Rhodobacteraceae bacterium NNCM2]|nr:four-carbon acid sugar kinase family protein [Coraliihabitans acroporae]
MLLGCIGDDFTGSSDLANTLAKQGMRTVLYSGIPGAAAAGDVEAGVVALKSRTIPVAEAVSQSLDALKWLQDQGCEQFIFKYCSTFDSTPEGNIGPVADALAEALEATGVIVCPAFPGTGRSIFQGHLFVKDMLLSESGMQNHPLTPMTDSDIRRWLKPQTRNSVGHIPAETVFRGREAIREALTTLPERLLVVDAIRDEDLFEIGAAASAQKLITGGSGIAMGLPANFRARGLIGESAGDWRGEGGPCAILSGSCSIATRGQVARHRQSHPAMEIAAEAVLSGEMTARGVADWILANPGLPLAYTSADPAVVAEVQQRHGRERSAAAIESLFAETARLLTEWGITRLITAGGETSGAVVEGLSVTTMEIGPEIDPGVPAMRVTGRPLTIALKSGNFGGEDFFEKAAGMLG